MVKVCHMTSVHKSNDARIFEKECVSLAKNGYKVYLVAPGESRVEKSVEVIGLGKQYNSRLKRMLYMSKKVYEKANSLDADIYHFHDPELLPYGLKLRKAGKIVIFDSHENYLECIGDADYIPKFFRKIITYAFGIYFKSIYKKMSGLIGVTPALCNQLNKYNNNVACITNYPIISNIYCENYYKKRRSMCLTMSHITYDLIKNILIAIEDINDIQFNVCGKIDDNEMKKIIVLKGWRKVNYYGYVSFNESLKIQNESIIGFILYKYSSNTFWNEGSLGVTKIFEYMLAKDAVICTNFNQWKEIIDKHNCGICVSPYEPAEIRSAILRIFENDNIAKKMGENGKKLIIEKFNWVTQESILVNYYKGILC